MTGRPDYRLPDGADVVFVAGESGPKARPFHLEHAREILDHAGVLDPLEGGRPAMFVKQLGAKPIDFYEWGEWGETTREPLKLRDRKGGDWSEWPGGSPRPRVPANDGRRMTRYLSKLGLGVEVLCRLLAAVCSSSSQADTSIRHCRYGVLG